MSEPDAAFFKLQANRAELLRWLDAPVPAASRWSDWRQIGGQWYLSGGQEEIATASEPSLQKVLGECDLVLSRHANNRAALQTILDSAEAEHLKIAGFNRAGTEFVAGSLTYSENLNDLIVFLTVARGAADFLGPNGYGLALIHNFLFGGQDEQVSLAALRLKPPATSEFMTPDDRKSAAGAFSALVDTMLDDKPDPEFAPRVQLDELR